MGKYCSTLLPPFTTTLYVRGVVDGIPAFRGVIKELEFSKVAIEPRIEHFGADSNAIHPGEQVTLSWRSKGLDRLVHLPGQRRVHPHHPERRRHRRDERHRTAAAVDLR